MEHYRDITSFHSMGKVISGTPESLKNIIDFLNFLSQVIFCEKVTVSVLGPRDITEGTISVINSLESMGLPQNFIERYSYPDPADRIEQRNRISQKLKYEWLSNFPILGKSTKESFPSGYYNMLDRSVDIFSDALLTNQSMYQFKSEIQESLNDDSISYMVGLILSDSDLLQLVREKIKDQHIGKAELIDFIALSRNKYNLLLAEDLRLAFTPSASRALKNTDTAYSFMNTYQQELNKDPREEMKKLRLTGKEYQLDIPSALHLLISKEASSVQELLDRALDARDKLSWYRKEVLSDFNMLQFSGRIEDKIVLSNRLDSVYNDVSEILSTNSKGFAKNFFGQFSWDLTSFTGLNSNGSAVWQFLKHIKNLHQFKQRKECYMLTQELIYFMSRSNSEYEVTLQKLFISLGGKFEILIKEKIHT
ncbi:hypothetical protein VST7929_00951 [Vibrio stylophorae]|uniref:Uncharacterized protein n=1 Tax=Vibrio stylophorae TaxID=659351 RepID=A0ABM8ZS22_9VIBR|nr:hypothetical protein [Vibrio stylophorae]CAH0533098.1 hypothetical protein VST7929_00951 [Vibrio stylophorae]